MAFTTLFYNSSMKQFNLAYTHVMWNYSRTRFVITRFKAIQSIFQAILIYQARWRAKSFPINYVIDLHSEIPRKSVDRISVAVLNPLHAPSQHHGWFMGTDKCKVSLPGRHLPLAQSEDNFGLSNAYGRQAKWESKPTGSSVGKTWSHLGGPSSHAAGNDRVIMPRFVSKCLSASARSSTWNSPESTHDALPWRVCNNNSTAVNCDVWATFLAP